MKRSTPEILLLIFGCTLALLVIIIAVGIVVIAVVNPQIDVTSAAAAIGTFITAMTGALIGYLAGRKGKENP